MGYWSDIEDRKRLCTCEHRKGLHAYISLVGANTGECLVRGCDCTIYEGAR